MTAKPWMTFCCAALLAASWAGSLAAQPGQTLPPPPPPVPTQNPTQAMPDKSAAAVQAPVQAAACGPQLVTCTVMVPQTTFKTITVPTVVCRPEVRQQNVTVCRMVPETTMETCNITVYVPERRTEMQPYTACRMTYETATRQVTVMVPHMETKQGTRTVCKPVAVQEMQTVCKDQGQWGTNSYVDCCGCTQTCQVWMPKIVTEQVPVTVYKPQFVQEPYTYQTVVCQPEQRTITEQVVKPVYETKTREVSYVVPVAKQVTKQVPRTTFRQVTENKVVSYTAMIPERGERQITVPVCTMVPKQVTYAVPPCGPRGCGW